LLKDPPTEKARAWIREMRGAAYQRYYLKSRLWREIIRPKVLERDDYTCTVCKRVARHVHHLSYDEATLLGRDLTKMKCVCVQHHESAHLGDPPLELIPLTNRFTEVNEEQRTEDRLRAEFNSVGCRLFVSAKLSRGWWTCDFRWESAAEHASVADYSDRHFYMAAHSELKLDTRNSNPGKAGGNRFTPQKGGNHCLIFFWDSSAPAEGKIKLRASAFPNLVAALKTLTSRHPFPVMIVADGGSEVARSGGYVEPPSPPEKPTKTFIEKWTDGECHSTLSESAPEWDKYPFGETIIQHDGPMP
jgi:hypothetical protein